jgi:superfamily II DNA or RNA helicase
VQELLTDPAHKAVVFSQWEVMIQKAAEVLDAAGVGYTLLHGRIPGKDRRKLIDRFRDDPACRVFLSTDAGGTGLNLQSADTVINLEVPWNPAVLEQRVARVHRMGQDRPVRVVHLVMRNSIEERVLRVVEQKRALFAGLFDGDTDEVSFAALGQPAFLEAVRELLEGEAPTEGHPLAGLPNAEEARAKLVAAGVQFLEALAALLAAEKPAAPPDLVARGTAALRAILGSLDGAREAE